MEAVNEIKEIIERWMGHFEEVLNVDSVRPELLGGTVAVAAQQLPEITTAEISEAEIKRCFYKTQEWKKARNGFHQR